MPLAPHLLKDLSSTALLLIVLAEASKVRRSIGKTLLTKVFFMSEAGLIKRGLSTPGYSFFRHTYGPFSKELYSDLDVLRETRLVQASGGGATASGVEISEYIKDELAGDERWQMVIENTLGIYSKYSGFSADRIKELVYGITVVPHYAPDQHPIKIRDIPNYRDILCPGKIDKAESLTLPDHVVETLLWAVSTTEQDIAEMKTPTNHTTEDILALLN